jgi:hypothetical protein
VVSASRLAKILDQEMIERNGGSIAPATTLDRDLPPRPGMAIADEIGGRLLIRYMLRRQLGMFLKGSTDRHFVTPTPLSPGAVRPFLALPAVAEPRPYAMLVDPAAIGIIQGPRWVRGGDGIEYLLPDGFPEQALVLPSGEIEVT